MRNIKKYVFSQGAVRVEDSRDNTYTFSEIYIDEKKEENCR